MTCTETLQSGQWIYFLKRATTQNKLLILGPEETIYILGQSGVDLGTIFPTLEEVHLKIRFFEILESSDPQLPKSIWYHTDTQWLGFRIVRPLKIPSVEDMDLIWETGIDHDTLE